MTPRENLHVVTTDTTIAELLERMFHERHTGYPVICANSVIGMVTLNDVRNVRTVERDASLVEDVMTEPVVTIAPDAEAVEAFHYIQQHDIGRLPVVNPAGDLVGLISRTDLIRAFTILQAAGSPDSDTDRTLNTEDDLSRRQPR